MNPRFRAFSFVDRISADALGHAVGHYTVPPNASRFPASLMAEAVGQLAAWSSMARLDFAFRPVAGLAAEARYFQQPQPGQTLQLEAHIERCDAEAVAYSGSARIDGLPAVEIVDCVGPMLPMEQFDDPLLVRADFDTLRGVGASADRFDGVPAAHISRIEASSRERLQALLEVPALAAAAYFGDHFPRRPVFPGTLLLDALAGLAVQLAEQSEPLRGQPRLLAKKISNVKIRAFTEPGTPLELAVELIDADAQGARFKLSARAAGKVVATARAEVAPARQP